jgi:hypothetical protein
MEAFLFTLMVVGLLITAGVVISVRLYTRGTLGTGRFRRIRRVRSLPGGTVIEDIIEEKAPVEDVV